MIYRFYKLIKSLLLLALILFFSACDPGCVKPYEFDSEIDQVESHPKDFIENSGFYDPITGGQRVNWKDPGVRIDGNQVILAISGSWVAWDTDLTDGDLSNDKSLDGLPSCNLCFKKILRDASGSMSSSRNCLCPLDQEPFREKLSQQGEDNQNKTIDCSGNDQDNPNLCTCSKRLGSISDLDTFVIATDYQNKSGETIHPTNQENCKFDKGAGLYLGVFGSDGNTEPLRIYHLYSTEAKCDVPRNSEGKCVDSEGKDITRYIYRSSNGKSFVRDDKNGNNGTDTNPSDDEYHEAGEKVKLVIYDGYYDDNYGNYNVEFLSGIIKTEAKGIIENIVRTIEDPLLGKISPTTGKREPGAVQYLYENIVKDSIFINFVQIILVLYITLFGFGVLAGLVEISRKEISVRIIKIALVLMFTSAASWTIYDQIVVGFFERGMNSIVSLFTSFIDSNLGSSSMIIAAQDDRAIAVSNATRFSYMDYLIVKLLSLPVAKKIWGLFFGGGVFGLLYIPMIYALIAFLIYVCLLAAFIYVSSLLKLVFVLALGPLFIIASLFSKTQDIFKRWLTFLASRGIEIITLFLVVYGFLILIDKGFTDLLSFEACTKTWDWWVIKFDVIESKSDRSFIAWIFAILKIGALLFLMKLIIEKIPGFVSSMVQVNDMPAKLPGMTSAGFMNDANNSASALFRSLAADLKDIGSRAVNDILPTVARYTIEAGGAIGRATGISDKVNEIKDKIPFRNPITMARDYFVIDSTIKQKQKEGIARGLTGKDLDVSVRKGTIEKLNTLKNQNKNAVLGIDPDSIAKRLDAKLIDEPVEKFLKSKFEEMRKSSPDKVKFGDELKDQLRYDVGQWAEKNSSVPADIIMNRLDESKFSSLINRKGELSTSDAARLFAGNDEMQDKYRQHLIDMKYEREKEIEKSKWFDKPKLLAKDARAELTRNTAYNPKRNLENFERKLRYEESKKEDNQLKDATRGTIKKAILEKTGINVTKGLSITKRINVLDKLVVDRKNPENTAQALAAKAEGRVLLNYVTSGYKSDLERVKKKYQLDLNERNLGKSKSDSLKEKRLKEVGQKIKDYDKKLAKIITEDESRKSKDELAKLKASSEDQRTAAIINLTDALLNGDKDGSSELLKKAGVSIDDIKNNAATFGADRLTGGQIEALQKLKEEELQKYPDWQDDLNKKEGERKDLYKDIDLDNLESLRSQSLAAMEQHLQALRDGNKSAELENRAKEATKNFYAAEKVRIAFDLKLKSDERSSKSDELWRLKSVTSPSDQELKQIKKIEAEISKLDQDINSISKVLDVIKVQENQLK